MCEMRDRPGQEQEAYENRLFTDKKQSYYHENARFFFSNLTFQTTMAPNELHAPEESMLSPLCQKFISLWDEANVRLLPVFEVSGPRHKF